MRRHRLGRLSIALLAVVVTAPGAPPARAAEVKELRVCADPFTLPLSNRKMEGFENRIADLLARDLGASLVYTWWPQRRGIMRAMNAGACDVLIGVPSGYDPVLTTRPYYRSAYEIVYRNDSGLRIESLDDPALARLRVGVQTNSPAHVALAQKGITRNVVGYETFYNDEDSFPNRIIDDLAAGKTDVAIVWGPLAGYFVKKQPVPMAMVPILDGSKSLPFAYDISVGVRRPEKGLVAALDAALARREADVRKILDDYGVPIVGEAAR